jgi:hypothetical protein
MYGGHERGEGEVSSLRKNQVWAKLTMKGGKMAAASSVPAWWCFSDSPSRQRRVLAACTKRKKRERR